MPAAKPIPEGFHSVTPYLVVSNTVKALEFYAKAFGAKTISRMPGPGGPDTTMHADMRIGDSIVLLNDEFPQWGVKSPLTYGGTPVSLHVYVEDADAAFQKAVAAGCTVQMPPADMFWGDRFAKVTDPFGHVWSIATRKENPSPEQLAQRQAEMLKKMSGGGACE
jgi:PhnB protein